MPFPERPITLMRPPKPERLHTSPSQKEKDGRWGAVEKPAVNSSHRCGFFVPEPGLHTQKLRAPTALRLATGCRTSLEAAYLLAQVTEQTFLSEHLPCHHLQSKPSRHEVTLP